MGTEEGIEGRRDGQRGQLGHLQKWFTNGLGGVIVCLLKGQRGGLGGRGDQIGFLFEDRRLL